MTKFEKISKGQFEVDTCHIDIDYNDIHIPRRATSGSAGYDFYSPIDFTLRPGESIKIPTGIRVILPKDKFLMVVPRSSLGFKYRLQLDNTVGVIDSDYSNSDNEGHIWIKITNDTKISNWLFPVFPSCEILEVKKGQAIAQGIILSYFTTDDDRSTGIRNGGFGSTDNNNGKTDVDPFKEKIKQTLNETTFKERIKQTLEEGAKTHHR